MCINITCDGIHVPWISLEYSAERIEAGKGKNEKAGKSLQEVRTRRTLDGTRVKRRTQRGRQV